MWQQACSFAACVAVSLCFCLEPVGRQACTSSFMPVRRPACGFYNGCVAVSLCVSFTKRKEKRKAASLCCFMPHYVAVTLCV